MELDDLKTVVDIVGTVVTAAAVIIGAVWAYYRFVKDRTYRPRLEVTLAGQWLEVGAQSCLLARIHVKNIGASKVDLLQKGTGLRISTMGDVGPNGRVEWTAGPVHPILENHKWIEPNETVSDDVLVTPSTDSGRPVLFEARLVWKWSGGDRNIVVVARRVVPADSIITTTKGQDG